jgi:hypothetical protein
MDSKVVGVVATLLLAAVAQAVSVNAGGDFLLWLKCEVVELRVNTTGANFINFTTLPQYKDLLAQLNKTFIVGRGGVAPLPMIGVEELKMLKVSDPKFKVRICFKIRLVAVKNNAE